MNDTNTISEANATQSKAPQTKAIQPKGFELALLRFSQFIAYLGGLALVALTVMTVYSIIGRSLFKSDYVLPIKTLGIKWLNIPSIELFDIPLQFLTWWRPVRGDVEMTEIATALIIFSFLPYCQMVRGNVLVDFFASKASPKIQIGMDILANGIFTLLTAVLTWRMAVQSEDLMTASWKQSSMILQIPMWWGILAATCFMAFLCLVCLFTFFRSIREVMAPTLTNSGEGVTA